MTSSYRDRFSGVGRLFGETGLEKISRANFAIIGIGGVGCWTAEALARSGAGHLTLVDLDSICVTNTNRQIHALEGEIGRNKVDAMARRISLINPEAEVIPVAEFFSESSSDRLLEPNYNLIVEAIDSIRPKCFLIAECRKKGIPLVVSGAAGGKSDPTRVSRADLAFATNDRLLKRARKILRRQFDFPPQELREPFGIPAVFSEENARFPWSDGTVREEPEKGGASAKLDCDSGFGTVTQVAGAMGFACAAEAIRLLLRGCDRRIMYL